MCLSLYLENQKKGAEHGYYVRIRQLLQKTFTSH